MAQVQKSSRRVWERYLESSTKLSQIKAAKMMIHINDDIVVLNKPPGVPVHDGPGLNQNSLITSVLRYWQFERDTPPSLTHRIDKGAKDNNNFINMNTSGILLLSRSVESARKMADLFKNRKIIKKYCALCVGVPEDQEGSIQIPLGVKNISTANKHKTMHRVVLRQDRSSDFDEFNPGKTLSGGVQLAMTQYSTITQLKNVCSLLDVTPVTGFKHQIRVHLADGILCPVVGDYKFAGPMFRLQRSLAKKMAVIGSTKGFVRGPMYLHAYQVVIPQEEGKPLIINAPLPNHFITTVESLGLNLPRNYRQILKT